MQYVSNLVYELHVLHCVLMMSRPTISKCLFFHTHPPPKTADLFHSSICIKAYAVTKDLDGAIAILGRKEKPWQKE